MKDLVKYIIESVKEKVIEWEGIKFKSYTNRSLNIYLKHTDKEIKLGIKDVNDKDTPKYKITRYDTNEYPLIAIVTKTEDANKMKEILNKTKIPFNGPIKDGPKNKYCRFTFE